MEPNSKNTNAAGRSTKGPQREQDTSNLTRNSKVQIANRLACTEKYSKPLKIDRSNSISQVCFHFSKFLFTKCSMDLQEKEVPSGRNLPSFC